AAGEDLGRGDASVHRAAVRNCGGRMQCFFSCLSYLCWYITGVRRMRHIIFSALIFLSLPSCVATRSAKPDPAKPQPGAVRPTPAERFVQAMDRAEKSFAYPDVTWAALKPEAAALGITMPFS